MHLILLSGGSGKRLWPLSNDVRSKQFLKLLSNHNSDSESMVQRVYRQISEVELADSITIIAGEKQKDQLLTQLGSKINLVFEPERRDTFPAIALACSYLLSEKKINKNEKIVVLPVDPYVENDFFSTIKHMEKIIEENASDIVLLGAVPTYASEKYGYIIPESDKEEISRVKYFKEKPEEKIAAELISEGALWNCGVFGFELGYLIDKIEKMEIVEKLNYKSLFDNYKKMKKTSFDYEVVENADNIFVSKYGGVWKDLGTWNTLSEEMSINTLGNVYLSPTSKNTHVINEHKIPLIALGIEDSVVIAAHDGILIAKKTETPKLKNIIAQYENRPMYEDKRWGSYKVLDHSFYEGTESLTKKLIIKQGEQISYQYHNHREEVWTIISGKGLLKLDDVEREVISGSVIKIPPLLKHGIKALTELEMIEVQLGEPLIEDDIVRLEIDW